MKTLLRQASLPAFALLLIVGAVVLKDSAPAPSQSPASSIAWVAPAGAGIIGPACASSSINSPSCVNSGPEKGSGQITITWNILGCTVAEHSMIIHLYENDGGTPVLVEDYPENTCASSVTMTGLSLGEQFGYSFTYDHWTNAQHSGGVDSVTEPFNASDVFVTNPYSTPFNSPNSCGGGGGNAPDLTAGVITPTSVAASGSYNFTATISNIGDKGTSGNTFNNLFQKATDNQGTGATDVGFVNAGPLLNGNTLQVTHAVAVSPNNSYTYLRVCADKKSANDTGTITESNENNNCGPWTQIKVGTPAAPTCTLSASGAGQVLTLNWTTNGATSGSIDHGVDGNTTPIASGSVNTAYPASATTYTMTITGPNGGNQCSATTGALTCQTSCCGPACPAPALTCSRSPAVTQSTAPVTVTYTVVPNSSAESPYTFTDALGNLLQQGSGVTYQKIYTNVGSYAVSVAANNVSPPVACGTALVVVPTCSGLSETITATPSRVDKGSQSNIAWTATGVQNSCIVTENGTTIASPSASSCSIPNGNLNRTINGATAYCIICDGNTAAEQCTNVGVNIKETEF